MRARSLLVVCSVWLVVASAACGGGTVANTPRFPAYTPQDARLFDDEIDPRVLGVSYDAPRVAPRGDAALFQRAQIGDGVIRGVIDSVTVKGSDARFELGIRVVESLAHGDAVGTSFVLVVSHSSPSFGLVRSLQARLSGRKSIVFVRTYANESGEAVTHFHMVPDDPQVADAVREATSLDRVPYSSDGGAPRNVTPQSRLLPQSTEHEKIVKNGP